MVDQETTKQTVLIADDEEALAQAIAATLDVEGLKTITAYDGEEALTLARALQPDLILLDVMMPNRSGIEVCATLKTDPATASIPIILITAKAEKTDRMVGIAAGADEYLTKPFSPTELISLVNEALAGRHLEPSPNRQDISDMPADQLVIYARELKDLFERERAERRALEKAQERLTELDRLKATFIGVVTHELLTPFAATGLALEVLHRQSKTSSDEIQEAVEDLATRIADLHQMVSGVVKFSELVSKQRAPQPGYITLDHAIPRAVQPVALLAQAREVDFRVFIPPTLSRVHADPDLLSEAVFQMAHNAVKFNLPQGEAKLSISEQEGWILIEVKDTGIGLTPERLELLGQPFEQSADSVRRGREGLGVGWAFVNYVAEVHNGWTRVESPGPDKGSTFSLILPAAPEQETTPAPETTAEPEPED